MREVRFSATLKLTFKERFANIADAENKIDNIIDDKFSEVNVSEWYVEDEGEDEYVAIVSADYTTTYKYYPETRWEPAEYDCDEAVDWTDFECDEFKVFVISSNEEWN